MYKRQEELYPSPIDGIMKYCIAGHHSGIPDGGFEGDDPSSATLHGRMERSFEDYERYREEISLPRLDADKLCAFLLKDCQNDKRQLVDKFSFLTRYCFSCLTDADSIDTAKFCGSGCEEHLKADFKECLKKVNERLNSFVSVSYTHLLNGNLRRLNVT